MVFNASFNNISSIYGFWLPLWYLQTLQYIVKIGSRTKAPRTKSLPIMKSTSYLCIGIFAHIFDLLYCYLWVNITFEYYFLPGYWGRFNGLSMLLLKWIKIVWSKRSRYFLGTILKSLKIPQGQSESVYAFCHVHKLLFAWLTDNIHQYCFLASELSIEKKIKYSRQAAYSQSIGFAINISHAQ